MLSTNSLLVLYVVVSVSVSRYGGMTELITQENFRRKDFPTKARLTYLKNKFLQVSEKIEGACLKQCLIRSRKAKN
jgi:hypothetical protein